ncbi:hypothetical protein TD95_000573 [Thielaviopsis punctulata]|uniref:Ammonium transporter n=1 Tax=Thielaviopsis punctulata TaxID=72032 RepID=A0A0F4ZMU2_9PEZI|nr:hypothetical protein TD95_000573 [Thielaviopsis punctulata]
MSSVDFGPPVIYNGTGDKGGDPTYVNLNQWYSTGDTAFILVASCLVLMMVPGIALLYSGLARRKSALSLLWIVMISFSVLTFQWYFWGYSLAYSTTASNPFIGNLHHFGLRHVLATPSQGSPLISTLLYSWFQLMFCAVTGALVAGAVCERGRVFPMILFIFAWGTIVYCPMAYWIWNANGWAFKWGVYDYAGGGPVEIASGMSVLAYSLVLGKRNNHMMVSFRPYNISCMVLGTVILFFGWMGFNGGSAFGANLRAVYSCWNTTLTAAFAAMAWVLLDARLSHKASMVGWCSGTISGLVAATPASGFIPLWASVVLGIVTGILCNFGTQIKFKLHIDDSLDVFAEHTIGGIIGLIFNGLFADENVIALDGVNNTMPGGGIDHHWPLLYKQIVYILAGCAYSFVVSYIIALTIDLIPGLHLRLDSHSELLGCDESLHGEFAIDYIEVRRDYLAWTPGTAEPAIDGVCPPAQVGIPTHLDLAAAAHAEKDRIRAENQRILQERNGRVPLLTRIIGPTSHEARMETRGAFKSFRTAKMRSESSTKETSRSSSGVVGLENVQATAGADTGASASVIPGPPPGTTMNDVQT